MCGIIGYWSNEKEAQQTILDSLKRLEYRGYDSFGFAILSDSGNLNLEKQIGKVSSAECENFSGKIGIGHTRWATHGKVNKENTHPQTDCTEKIFVVHNGIIENYQELRKKLTEKGHLFKSETDTEIIPHLIEQEIKNHRSLKEAVIYVGKVIKGRNAFVVMDISTKEMIAYRNGSPLILGVKKGEIFVASDIQAFIHKTNRVMYLDDGQLVLIKEDPEFFNSLNGEIIHKRIIELNVDPSQAEKGDYPHFMLKEIMEQKGTIIKAINQNDRDLLHIADEINKAKGVFFIGCGTAARVCHTAEYIFSEIDKKHINFVPASEFGNYKHFLVPETLVIAISQSGETADVLEALNVAKEKCSKVISILNTPESSIAKKSDYVFYLNAGPERAVASTKATTSQLAIVILLAYTCAGKLQRGYELLIDLAAKVNDMLNPRYGEHIKNVAKEIYQKEDIFIIGRGINYPLSLESAIKIIEVSYIHAQGFAGGELKHGPIALIEKDTPVIVLVSEDNTKNDIISNAMEVKSRGAKIIGVSPENNPVFDLWIKTPNVPKSTSVIANLIPIQLLAYYLGILRGEDVDCPRSLAKSVTVK